MIITEPVAAALMFGVDQNASNANEKKTCLVYDFGGGTLDVTILELYQKKVTFLDIQGDDHLGGQDMDQLVVEWAVKSHNEQATEAEQITQENLGQK